MPVTERGPQSHGLSRGCSPAQVTSLPNLPPSVTIALAVLVGSGSKGPPKGSPSSPGQVGRTHGWGSGPEQNHPSKGSPRSGQNAELRDFQPLDLNPKGFPQGAQALKPGGGSTVPGSRGEGWGPCKVPETVWSHWLSWTRGRALAFSMGACTRMFPKGHYTCSTPSCLQEAHELACKVGRVVHWGV